MNTILVSVRYDGKTYYNRVSIDYTQECLDDCIVEYGLGNITAYHVDCQLPAGLDLPAYGSSEQGYGITIESLGEGWLLPIETSTTEPVKIPAMSLQKTRAEIIAVAQNLKIQNGFIHVYSFVDDSDSRADRFEQYSIAELPATVEGVQIDFYDEFGRILERLESTVETIVTPESSVEELPALTSKQSVVCTIAAKLTKAGVKNPMATAWKIYRITLDCLHAIAKRCYFDFYASAYQLESILVQHRVTDISQVLPPAVCAVFKKHALSLTI